MTGPVRATGPTSELAIDDSTAEQRALFHLLDAEPSRSAAGAAAASSEFRVRPTSFGRGPWDHGLLHGGPVVGLAAWASERLTDGTGLVCARLTAELHHGVPLADLDVSSMVVRASRRSIVVDATIRHGSRVVARSSSQWLLPSTGWQSDGAPVPSMPPLADDPGAGDFDYPRPGFNCDVAEVRYSSGSNELPGPAVVWIRLTSPLMAGQPTSPFVRLATVADLAAAAGFERGPDGEAFINADVTLQLDRLPSDEWIALDARTHRAAGGLGHNEATVFDVGGAFGRILQSLVETEQRLDSDAGDPASPIS